LFGVNNAKYGIAPVFIQENRVPVFHFNLVKRLAGFKGFFHDLAGFEIFQINAGKGRALARVNKVEL
jgi:hypothetical protein